MIYHTINISLIPPLDVAKRALKLVTPYAQLGSEFNIANNDAIHITLYYTEFPAANIKKLLVELKTILKKEKPIRLIFNKIRHDQEYLSLDFERSERIANLHMHILKTLNPYREGHLRDKYLPNSLELLKLPKMNQQIALTWGHPYVAEKFIPHITLLKFDTPLKSATIEKESLKWDLKSIICDQIVVYEQKPQQKPYQIIAKFKLH